ncbi:hypothetical protein HYS97_03080 [Candidatus Daviesbacteria bacterium]|nr:hypothetical protein [Candidatus Daviesbacteria bacterium]
MAQPIRFETRLSPGEQILQIPRFAEPGSFETAFRTSSVGGFSRWGRRGVIVGGIALLVACQAVNPSPTPETFRIPMGVATLKPADQAVSIVTIAPVSPSATPRPTETPFAVIAPEVSPRSRLDILNGFIKSRYWYEEERRNKLPDQIIAEERGNILLAAAYHKKATGSSKFEVLSPEQISINGQTFDLKDPTQRVFAGALADVAIEGLEQKRRIYLAEQPAKAEDEIRKLIAKVRFVDSDGPPHLHPNDLMNMQQALELLAGRGKPYPKVWATSRGIFSFEKPANNPDGVLHFDPYHSLEGLAEYYRATDPNLYPEFVKRVAEAGKAKIPGGFIEGLDLLAPRYSYRLENTLEEQFRQAFVAFITSGQRFRNRVEYAIAVADLVSANVLTAKYDPFRERLGFETLGNGVIKEEVDLSIGKVVEVVDYEGPRGIVLKKTPTNNMKPENLVDYVVNEMVVRVLSGPQRVDYPDLQSSLYMVKVEAGDYGRAGNWESSPYTVGYMPVQYLRNIRQGPRG